jgi:hypothetical protein
MAKNWKVGEAARAIMAGNKEDILDIGRRFPLFLNLVSQINEPAAKILDTIPEYVTARKVESVLKGEAQDDEAGEVPGDEGEPKEAKEAKKEPDKKEAKDAYAGKTAKELFTLCKERKIEVEPKQAPEVYIKALKKADAAKAKAEAAKKEAKEAKKPAKDDEDWGDEGDKKEEKKADKKADDDDWDV